MSKTKTEEWRGSAEYWAKLVEVYSAMLRANRQSYIYIPLAGALEKVGRTREAIDTLEDGLAMMPESRSAMSMLGRLKYDSGDIEGARAILTKVVGRWPDVTAAVFLLCRIYEREGDIASALKASDALLDYYPDSRRVQELVDRYARMEERLQRTMSERAAAEKIPDEPQEEPMEMELVIAPALAEEAAPQEEEQEAEAVVEEASVPDEAFFAEEDDLTEAVDIIPIDELPASLKEDEELPAIDLTEAQIDLTDTWFGEMEDEPVNGQAVIAEPVAEDDGAEETDEALLKLESMMERIYHLKNIQQKERTKSNV